MNLDLEHRIEALRKSGDLRGSATLAIEGYGPEVFGFLVTVLRDEQDASEVFSQTCEDLWRGMARFEGRCAMRTWLYTLARNAKERFRRSPHRREGRHVVLSEISEVAEGVRSRTSPHLRTSVKDQFAAIRDSLSEDDRALLVLRVDRGLRWSEIARTFSPDDAGDETLRRAAARLRKRFQSVTEEIHERARQAGLLEKPDDDGES
ncbi:MAG: RNA polymerase sigma factor [Polyangiaceae bacterium]